MNKAIVLIALVFIAGCDNRSDSEKLYDAGLGDCSMHDVSGITVIRCPNSTTTTKYLQGVGKGVVLSRQSIVIDGQKFVIDNEKGD